MKFDMEGMGGRVCVYVSPLCQKLALKSDP